eukprot:gene11990-16052_t
MSSNVKILLIGDPGVGKSSLISTYISHHFPYEVPSVLTDCIIPADTTANNVCVTILDSSPYDLEILSKKVVLCDSIIACYDTSRPETLENLTNMWLPMVKKIAEFNNRIIPVIVVATKMDKYSNFKTGTMVESMSGATNTIASNGEDEMEIENEEIDKLQNILGLFPFVFLCLRCSAEKLQNIYEVFYHAELVVTFPLTPLYDVISSEFTLNCRKAFLRIFRIFDLDLDNLLNDAELCDSQSKVFDVPINTEELMAMKKQISQLVMNGLSENKLTFEGFLGIIKLLINKHQFQIPWTMLRRFDYDNELNLSIPEEISALPSNLKSNLSTELSFEAIRFLRALAKNSYFSETIIKPPNLYSEDSIDSDMTNAYSSNTNSNNHMSEENQQILTWDALKAILYVIVPENESLWLSPPSYQSTWFPTANNQTSCEQTIILSNLPHIGANITIESWISHWKNLALHDPIMTQILLFRLGYVERSDFGIVNSLPSLFELHYPKSYFPLFNNFIIFAKQLFNKNKALKSIKSNNNIHNHKSIIKIAVFGDNNVGKSSFVWKMSGLNAPGEIDIEKGMENMKAEDSVVIGGFILSNNHESHERDYNKSVFISLAAVPMNHLEAWLSINIETIDIIIFMYQVGDINSLNTIINIEEDFIDKNNELKKKNQSIPRLYIGNKSDLIPNLQLCHNSDNNSDNNSLDNPYIHQILEKNQHLLGLNYNVNFSNDYHNNDSSYKIKIISSHYDKVNERINNHIQKQKLSNKNINYLISTLSNQGIIELKSKISDVLDSPVTAIPYHKQYHANKNKTRQMILNRSILMMTGISFTYLFKTYQKEITHFIDEQLTKWGMKELLTANLKILMDYSNKILPNYNDMNQFVSSYSSYIMNYIYK